MKNALLRFIVLYILANVLILMDVIMQGPHTLSAYFQRGMLVGVGGIFVYLFSTRLGSGSVDDSPLVDDEEMELRRANRRSWLLSALMVAIILLLTEAVYVALFISR